MLREIFLLHYKEESLMFTFFFLLENIFIFTFLSLLAPLARRRKFLFYLPAVVQRAKLFNDNERIKLYSREAKSFQLCFVEVGESFFMDEVCFLLRFCVMNIYRCIPSGWRNVKCLFILLTSNEDASDCIIFRWELGLNRVET